MVPVGGPVTRGLQTAGLPSLAARAGFVPLPACGSPHAIVPGKRPEIPPFFVGQALARKRCAPRAFAFAASMARSRGGALLTRASSRWWAVCATSSTAWLNAASFAFDGRVKPESLRTNCSALARSRRRSP